MVTTDQIKQLRQQTGVGVIEAKKALDASQGDMAKAIDELKKSGAIAAAKRADRTASQGIVKTYSHNGRIGVMVEVNCETDFVARNDAFVQFVNDLALHIAAMRPITVEELLKQEFVKDSSQTINDLLVALISKTHEKVDIKRFVVYGLGEE